MLRCVLQKTLRRPVMGASKLGSYISLMTYPDGQEAT